MVRTALQIFTLLQSKQMAVAVSIVLMLSDMFVCSAPSHVDMVSSGDLFSATILVQLSQHMNATLLSDHQSRETASVLTAKMNSTGMQENGKR
jgi:hypothetical protein